MQYLEQKRLIKKALKKVVSDLMENKSNFLFGAENDISTSILSDIKNEKKDPQLTTIFRLAEAFNLNVHDFVKLINNELPEKFSFIEK